jgi:WD40 repeat protein
MALHSEHDLLQAYLEGTLPDKERASLEARLAREPQLAEALVVLAREEAVYAEWAASHSTTDRVLCEARRTLPGARKPRRLRRIVAVATAVAAIVVFSIFGAYLRRPSLPAASNILAQLEDVQGDVVLVSAEGTILDAEAGQSLYPGQEIRTGGEGSSTAIRVQDSRLVLASETRIRLGPEKPLSDAAWLLVFVSEGILSAELTPRPDGRSVVISSSLAELRGSAGRFSFASLPERTWIESDDGTARVIRKSDGKSLDLVRGQYAIAANNEPLKSQHLPARWSNAKRAFTETASIAGLFFDPEGFSLCTCAGDAIKRRELSSGRVVSSIRLPARKKPARSFAPSRDGNLFAVALADEHQVRLYDALTGVEKASFKNTKRPVTSAFSADGRLLAVSWSAKDGHELRFYDTTLGLERVLLTGHSGAVQGLAFSPRGTFLATIGDRSIKFWDAGHFGHIRSLSKLSYEPRCLAFAPDERALAVGDRKGGIHLIDLATGSERTFAAGHLRELTSLAYSPNGSTLLSGSSDGTARLWHVASGRELATLKTGSQTVSSVTFSHDGLLAATAGADRKIALWDISALDGP